MEYGPCLFRIKRKGIGFVSMHVDDADGCFEFAEDGQWWAEATNDLFKTDNQPGIKLVDPGHMLGVSRILNETEQNEIVSRACGDVRREARPSPYDNKWYASTSSQVGVD